MPLVLASPAPDPTTTDAALEPRLMTWTGVDRSVWPLTRPAAVNPRMGRGVKGLHMPPVEVFRSSTPLVPGDDITGYALPERPVYWPLLFRANDVEQWEAQHAAFMDSFHPVEVGTWTVGEGEKARTLQLRGGFGNYAFTRDPFITGLAWIGLELFAPRPLWRGAPIRQTFYADEPVDFIPAEAGDEYHPSPVASFATATIDNPGNEPAYLKWEIEGPQDELTLGVGGAIIDVPFEVADGSTLIIDTDPAGQYATLDGADVNELLGFQMFAPVPARGTTPLTITSAGSGSVTAELVPLYWRAF